jgi:hypothetical protein
VLTEWVVRQLSSDPIPVIDGAAVYRSAVDRDTFRLYGDAVSRRGQHVFAQWLHPTWTWASMQVSSFECELCRILWGAEGSETPNGRFCIRIEIKAHWDAGRQREANPGEVGSGSDNQKG